MINDAQLTETLEGKSAPKCAAANGGVPCEEPVAHCGEVFLQKLWFCGGHWEERGRKP